MRREMLERREGEMLLNVRIHYDSMVRSVTTNFLSFILWLGFS